MVGDADMLAGLQRRDPEAFTRFFDAHVDRVYRLALGMLGQPADAEEVVQATFLSAFQAIERFEPHAHLSTWLYRIAYNHALMLLRRRHPEEPLPDDQESLPLPETFVDWSTLPEEQLLSEEVHQTLFAAISELPERLRAAFVLRDVEALSTSECAHVQGISEAACKVRLHRARLLLRETLSQYFREWAESPTEAP